MSDRSGQPWIPRTFGAIAKRLVNGGTPPTSVAAYWSGTIPWITGADFAPSGLSEFRRYVSANAVAHSATNVIEKGELLLVTRTGVGKLAIAPCDVAISQDITGVYLDREQVDVGFIFYRMLRGAEDLKKLNQGTSINGIVRRDLLSYPMLLPPLPQQSRIGEILRTIDDAIGQTEALIAKTKQIKAGLMQDLFTRGVTPDGRLRPSREEAPGLYKASPLGWIPTEWEAGDLAQKRSANRPHLKTGPFGSSLKLEHWVEEGRPVITIGALGEGEFIRAELLYVSEETARDLREYQMEVGDVVFSRVADVGRSVAIGREEQGWIMSSNLMRISLDRELVAPAFLQAELAYDSRVRRQIRATVNAGGRDVANSETLNRLAFPWPPRGEQDRIVDRLEGLEGVRRSKVEQVEKLKLERAGLMHDLLTGRVRVRTAEAP